MKNFEFYNPTEILFGKGEVNKLGKKIASYGEKVLLVYGHSSIKKIGLYDKVIKQLNDAQMDVYEVSGVDPNPRVESVRQGQKICKAEDIDIILAVGGGSVIDCAKAIGLSAYYDGDPWDIYTYKAEVTGSLPIASILTLSATGTEMNGNSVISNMKTKQKNGFGSIYSYPVFSILDPENTFSVSKHQTGCGIVDSLTHIYEFYFSKDVNYLNDRIVEAIMRTIIHYGPIAIENPKDYEARANLMFASTLALNGLSGFGKTWDGFNHTTEHVLSAHYDIAHGDGLAITAVHWMNYILDETTVDKFYQFAVNVWNIEPSGNKMNVAKQGIKAMTLFYQSIGMPTTLKEVDIVDPDFDLLAKQAFRNGSLGRFKSLTQKAVKNILINAK
jgi:alcohol dehydrogenase YqhD (iron-dependent ADH family)